MYTYVAITSFLCGMFVSLFSTFLNVEFVKKIDEEYLARAAGIMTSLSVASVPIASIVVGALAAVIEIECLFIVSGMLAIAVCPFFLRSKVLEEREDYVKTREANEEWVA